jgi:hypothetical protein
MNIRHPKKLKIECECGTPFCEGIVCKLSTENQRKKNSSNLNLNNRNSKKTLANNNNNKIHLVTVDVKNDI